MTAHSILATDLARFLGKRLSCAPVVYLNLGEETMSITLETTNTEPMLSAWDIYGPKLAKRLGKYMAWLTNPHADAGQDDMNYADDEWLTVFFVMVAEANEEGVVGLEGFGAIMERHAALIREVAESKRKALAAA